ncbi:MAG TPA: type II secretion system protein GspG [Polyangia bacterium]|nr:type II secretion system protein GspG [Polyangia bacterium]
MRGAVRPRGDGTTSVHETTVRTMRAVSTALARYQAHYDEPCPRTLWTLVSSGYLPAFPRDGWGETFVYQCPSSRGGDRADLVSAGADGHLNTADDIHSWELR